jgi:hypothetical protein
MILDLLISLPLASDRAWMALQALPALLVAIVLAHRRYQSSSVERTGPSALELDGPLPPPMFLASKVIQPALEAENIPSHGYHAFRRGLATNPHHL